MAIKTLALFPGQGSQKVGMGKEVSASDPLAKQLFEEADSALGFSLSALCFEGPADELTKTAVAQPAILTVSTVMWRLAQRELGDSLTIVSAAGHSLGEYSAYVAAGAISFSDAVRIVHRRGTYMQEAVPAGVGAMVAVLGGDISAIEAAAKKISAQSGQVVEIANINDPTQVVVAGKKESVTLFSAELTAALGKVKIIELQVSAPFHCSLMKPAEDTLALDLAALKISKPSFPVYSNYLARQVSEPDEIRDTLRKQVTGRVRWVESMNNAISETQPERGIEFGNGAVLTGLFKRINKDFKRFNVDSLSSLEALK